MEHFPIDEALEIRIGLAGIHFEKNSASLAQISLLRVTTARAGP
jgi:hypothetical protein